MGDFPRTAVELRDMFPTEQACRDYLVRLWPERIVCPDCGATEVWAMTPPFYRCAHCGYDFTATAGTLFADTHKPLRLSQAGWFDKSLLAARRKPDHKKQANVLVDPVCYRPESV